MTREKIVLVAGSLGAMVFLWAMTVWMIVRLPS